jgi:hypothetical protein
VDVVLIMTGFADVGRVVTLSAVMEHKVQLVAVKFHLTSRLLDAALIACLSNNNKLGGSRTVRDASINSDVRCSPAEIRL